MDYEKKYNDALKRAKELLLGNEQSNTIRSYFEHIFPELRESEDERIRKVIYKLMLGMREEIFTSQDEIVTKEKVLAYLEKQKEQKPISTEDMPYVADEHFFEREPADSFKYKLAEYMTKNCKKGEGPYGYSYNISSESILQMAKEELIKRGELPPVEWSDEDEDHLKWLCRIIHSRKVHGELSLEEESELGQWIDRWINHNPQPKWDEFDENCLKRAIWYVENPAPSVIKDSRLALWLNTLRSRFFLKPQPKAEWSEEDEKNLELVTDCVYEFYPDPVMKYKLKDWLTQRFKFIRPQPKEEWTDEDQKALKVVTDIFMEHGVKMVNYPAFVHWLKNLPIRFILSSPASYWKPSEDEERLIKTSISFLKDFADKGYENAVECIDWLKSKLNGNSC